MQVGPIVRYDALPAVDLDPVSCTIKYQRPRGQALTQQNRLYTGPKTYSRSHCLLEPLLGGSKCTGRNVARVPTFIDSFGRSKSLGPHRPWGHLDVPPNSKILFRRLESCFMYLTLCPSDGISSFDDDQISLTVYRNSRDASPYLLLRIFDQGTPWFALRGVHELCIERNGSCLQFKRWSRSEKRSKTWAVLCFMTWEGMRATSIHPLVCLLAEWLTYERTRAHALDVRLSQGSESTHGSTGPRRVYA